MLGVRGTGEQASPGRRCRTALVSVLTPDYASRFATGGHLFGIAQVLAFSFCARKWYGRRYSEFFIWGTGPISETPPGCCVSSLAMCTVKGPFSCPISFTLPSVLCLASCIYVCEKEILMLPCKVPPFLPYFVTVWCSWNVLSVEDSSLAEKCFKNPSTPVVYQ